MANSGFEYVIKLLLQGADAANSGIKEVGTSLDGVSHFASKAGEAIKNGLGSINLQAVIQNISSVNDALQSISDTPLGFEQSAADLSSITGIVGKDLDALKQTAREFGTEAGIGAKAAADSYAVLASQIQVDQIGMEGLQKLQKETITLSQAAGMGLADAASALSGTINQFGLDASESTRVINVLAAGSKYGAAEITELSQSFKVTGAVAAGAKISLEETAGALEVLSKNNLKGSESGTALRNIILKLQTELGIDLGETGLSKALEALKPKLQDVTFLSKTFGVENVAAAQFLITNAGAVEEMTAKVTDTNVAYEQAEIRTNTWTHKLEVAKAKIDDWKISLTDATGSMIPYATLLSSQAVTISQLLPLMNGLKSTIGGVIPAIIRMTTVQGGLNAVLVANPIGAIAVAVAGLGAILVAAYKHCDDFRAGVDSAWRVTKELFGSIKNALTPAFEALMPVIRAVGEFVRDYIVSTFNAVGKAIKFVAESVESILPAHARHAEGLATTTAKAREAEAGINKFASEHGLLRTRMDGSTYIIARSAEAIKKQADETDKAGKSAVNFADKHSKATKEVNRDLESIGGVQTKLTDLQTKLLKAHETERSHIASQIALLEQKKQKMLDLVEIEQYQAIKGNKKVGIDGQPLDKVRLPGAEKSLQIPATLKLDMGKQMQSLNRYTDDLSERLKNKFKNPFGEVRDGLNEASFMMRAFSGVLGDGAGKWLEWGSNLLSTVSAAIPALTALFAANSKVAASEAGKAVAGVPLVGPGMAVAAIASIIGALMAIPFADGGVVSGPTYALVGEYAGARNNPEVIAPLNKLRDLLRSDDNGGLGEVEFVIRGDRLVGIANKFKKRKKYT